MNVVPEELRAAFVGRWAWLPKNVARNSHVNLSNVETRPLGLQRLWAVLNFRVAELRATLGRVWPW